MQIVKKALESSSGAVRSKATELAITLYEIVGDLQLMSSYLSDLKTPAVRDSLLAAFESIQLDPRQSRNPLPSGAVGSVGGIRQLGGAGPSGEEMLQLSPPLGSMEVEPRTCQFCGRHDPSFDEETMDLHFWKDCPMLMPCDQCGQVVEVAALAEHLVTECDQSQDFRYPPPLGVAADFTGCPLCGEPLPGDPAACKDHIMHRCGGNPRRVVPA
eukprot:CAMPEP_0181184700 /NCGR_PEP_ID=MMETSP1096-20121128/9108_1 /TAXON_ID=156174 ORGANISM="Chrysochromulina ericina, Strain CCMP281" /NCGR_SAMPLE_ID=MMETSP1096 /ASSEMBLY_ACC=CAM_ASM_000453 /LENGTH=213 /DNA_ID=CAMNT_0023273483 /DNA_START=1 /DNA_END=642 /DNA_ORIENTATION=+